jgi:DHA1 family bicyclomycin/chloramphenicol resistance-like MFS transporter
VPLASGIEILIGGRFLQALGASAPIVLGRAIVRDLFEGVRAGRELSRMGTILGFVPALGPVLGGLLEAEWGWRAAFWTMCGVGVVLLAVAASALPETLRAYAATPVSIASILRGYRIVWSAPSYRRYACLAALGYAGLFAFISASSFVLQRHYGLSPIAYGLSFGAAALGFSIGTLIGQRVVHSLGLDGTIGLGTAFFLTGGLAMVAATFAGVPSSLAITAPMLLYTIGHGLVLPAAQALSLMPFPDRAGAASSLLGIVQMTLAAGIGIVTGHAISVSPLMLPVIVAAMGASAFALFRAGRGRAVLNGRRGG